MQKIKVVSRLSNYVAFHRKDRKVRVYVRPSVHSLQRVQTVLFRMGCRGQASVLPWLTGENGWEAEIK